MNLVLYGAEPNMLDNILIDQQVAENQLISETQGFNLDAKLGFQGKDRLLHVPGRIHRQQLEFSE